MINLTGEKVILFKNERGNYSTSISNKKQDGTYESMYVPVNMPKNADVENKAKINIQNGFLSFYKNSKNENVVKIVVMQYELAEEAEENLPF